MAHSREELRRFQNGETRMVFARRRDNPREIVWMEDGKACEMREMTRNELICIVDGCDSPEMKAVSRSRARDGFSHLSGGQHAGAGMGIHHLQGQLMMERWVQKNYARHLEVEAEYTTEDRTRRADIMLTSKATSRRVALEIQYAALSVEEWRARHDSYERLEIPDVWLFGHAGDQLRSARGGTRGEIRLNAVHEAVIKCGSVPLWLNPVTAEVAWAVRPYDEKLLARSGEALLCIRPLNEFTLAPDGLHHRHLDLIRERSAEIWAQEQRREEDAKVRASRARETELQRAEEAAPVESEEQRHERMKARSAVTHAEWLAKGGEERVRAELNGHWPTWLKYRTEPVLHVPPEQWQSHLYLSMIRPAPTGAELSLKSLIDEFIAEFGMGELQREDIRRALLQWIWALTGHEVLRARTSYSRTGLKFAIRVLTPMAAEQRAGGRQRRSHEAKMPATSDTKRPGKMESAAAGSVGSTMPSYATTDSGCRKCGGELDEVLRSQGVHIGCRIGW